MLTAELIEYLDRKAKEVHPVYIEGTYNDNDLVENVCTTDYQNDIYAVWVHEDLEQKINQHFNPYPPKKNQIYYEYTDEEATEWGKAYIDWAFTLIGMESYRDVRFLNGIKKAHQKWLKNKVTKWWMSHTEEQRRKIWQRDHKSYRFWSKILNNIDIKLPPIKEQDRRE